MQRLVWSVIAFLCCSTITMASETFRCGQWVVSQDVTVAELLKKCGEPARKTSSTQDVLVRTANGNLIRNGVTTTEVWTYDRGSRALLMIVTIVDGNIESMSHNK